MFATDVWCTRGTNRMLLSPAHDCNIPNALTKTVHDSHAENSAPSRLFISMFGTILGSCCATTPRAASAPSGVGPGLHGPADVLALLAAVAWKASRLTLEMTPVAGLVPAQELCVYETKAMCSQSRPVSVIVECRDPLLSGSLLCRLH